MANDCDFKMKTDASDLLVNDSMNMIFDTIHEQIYIISSLGHNFELISTPLDQNLTKIKMIDRNEISDKETV